MNNIRKRKVYKEAFKNFFVILLLALGISISSFLVIKQALTNKDKNESILEAVLEEKESIEKLIESYNCSNKLLKKVVEGNDVNEQYIFEILDKWAEERNLKNVGKQLKEVYATLYKIKK